MSLQLNLSVVLFIAALVVVLGCSKKDGADAGSQSQEGPYTYVTLPGTATQKIFYQVENGLAVVGDIILSTKQAAEKNSQRFEAGNRGAVSLNESTYMGFKWPNGKVYYRINNDGVDKKTILKALGDINKSTGIVFIDADTTDDEPTGLLVYQNSDGCSSYVGRSGKTQPINLNPNCGYRGAVHETGHALGLMHEHQREDRDQLLVINWNNIDPYYHPQFQLFTGGKLFGKHDLNSVMHYDAYAFSRNNDASMQLKAGGFNFGKATSLSQGDIDAIKELYKSTGNGSGDTGGGSNPITIPQFANQSLAHGATSLSLDLKLSAAAKALPVSVSVGDGQTVAHALDQQYKFTGSAYDFGDGNKWFQGDDGTWFMIAAGGIVYIWAGSVDVIGVVGDKFYNDPSQLIDAKKPVGSLGTGSVSNGVLSLTMGSATPVGARQVKLAFQNGDATIERTFNVTIPNKIPTIDAIASQTISRKQIPLDLSFAAKDGDNDALNVSVQVLSEKAIAYETKTNFSIGPYYTQYPDLTYLTNDRWENFYLYPNGLMYRDSDPAKPVADLGANVGKNPLMLVNAAPASSNLTGAIVNGKIRLSSASGDTSGFHFVRVTAADAYGGSATRSFKVEVTSGAPVLTAISAKSMSHTADKLSVAVSATDVDGDAITYTATAYSYAYYLKAIALKLDASTFYNWGTGWMVYSADDAFLVDPDGKMYRMSTGLEVKHPYGTSLYSNPEILLNATATTYATSFSGSTLTIDPPADFAGSLYVIVTATDSSGASSSTSFQLTVTNTAPVVASIQNQVLAKRGLSVSVPASATDADNDPITFSVRMESLADKAYRVVRALKLDNSAYEYTSTQKAIYGEMGVYIIQNDGKFFDPYGTHIETFSSDYWKTPELFFQATEPTGKPPATFTLANGQLNLNCDATFAGAFLVTLTASDKIASASKSFFVTVNNKAPTLSAISQKTTPVAQALSIPLTFADADGDTLTVKSELISLAQVARDLDDKEDFVWYRDYDSEGVHYFVNRDGLWFMLQESDYAFVDLQTYKVLMVYDKSFFDDPTGISEPVKPSGSAGTSTVSGKTLTVKANQKGSYIVKVSVSDGAVTATQQFRLIAN